MLTPKNSWWPKVRVKLRNLADLDFDLDPNWGSQIMPGNVAQVVWNLNYSI